MRRLVTLAVVGGALAGAAPAAACSIAAPLPGEDRALEAFRDADLAFFGRVTKVRSLEAPAGDGAYVPGAYEATIRISRVYKGRTGPALRVRSSTDGASCGFGPMRVGRQLGLLLSGRRSPWAISIASGISRRELERVSRGRSHRPGRR